LQHNAFRVSQAQRPDLAARPFGLPSLERGQ
jgi:hypothetical protein